MATKPKTAALKTPSDKASTSVALKSAGGDALVAVKAQMALDLAKVAGMTAPASGNMIRVTQDKQFILPDGTKTPGPIDLVIIDFNSRNTLYAGAYDPKNIESPICFAIGDSPTTMVPSSNSPEKQCDSCAGCAMNQYESATTGKGKACNNNRILAVLPADTDEDTPMWTLSVSPTALKGFDGYVNSIARQFQVPPYGVVTRVSFNPNVTYASLVFSDPQPNQNLEMAYSRRAEAAKMLVVEPDVSGYVAAPKKVLPVRRK